MNSWGFLFGVTGVSMAIGYLILSLLKAGEGHARDKWGSSILFRFVLVGSFGILPTWATYLVLETLWGKLAAEAYHGFLFVWLVNAPAEEITKFLCFALLSRRLNSIKEPQDGILQGAATGLGFALVENFQYSLGGGLGLLGIRSIVSLPGHMIYGAVWGGYYGYEVYRGRGKIRRPGIVLLALLPAVFAHGAYNTALSGWGLLPALVADALALVLALVLFRTLRGASAYSLTWEDLASAESFEKLRHALRVHPDSFVLRRKWAVALLLAGRLVESEAVFRKATKQSPFDLWNPFWAGVLAWERGDHDASRMSLAEFRRRASPETWKEARRIRRVLALDFPIS